VSATFDREAWRASGKPLALDLCSGKGGWVKGLQSAGFYVVAVDIRAFAENPADQFLVCDVRELDGSQFTGAVIATSSPPCVGFTQMRVLNPLLRDRPRPIDFLLVLHCLRVIDEAKPRYWLVENVAGAVGALEPILGEPTLKNKPYYLWGHFPGFVLSQSNRLKMKTGAVGIAPNGRPRFTRLKNVSSAAVAEIPFQLARAVAEAAA
jgi:hypothetical protein